MTDVQKSGIIPLISNSGKMISTVQIISMFIIQEKKPRVTRRKGNAIKFKIGFAKKFIIPKNAPIRIKTCQKAVNWTPNRLLWPVTIFRETPEINFVDRKRLITPAII